MLTFKEFIKEQSLIFNKNQESLEEGKKARAAATVLALTGATLAGGTAGSKYYNFQQSMKTKAINRALQNPNAEIASDSSRFLDIIAPKKHDSRIKTFNPHPDVKGTTVIHPNKYLQKTHFKSGFPETQGKFAIGKNKNSEETDPIADLLKKYDNQREKNK